MLNLVIMPFLDCWEMTREAAEDALSQEGCSTTVLLIDGGSSREVNAAAKRFQTQNQRVLLWTFNPPLPSLAATWNRALEFAWDAGAEYALVPNNDVRLLSSTFETLKKVQRMSGALFCTAMGVKPGLFDAAARPEAEKLLESRGGPDFSCFLITKECHSKYKFDERFQPAYHEDGDFHRQLWLGGDGSRIFGVALPFLHFGSSTINRSKEERERFAVKFRACQARYVEKWGGLPHQEKFVKPDDPTSTREGVETPGGWITAVPPTLS